MKNLYVASLVSLLLIPAFVGAVPAQTADAVVEQYLAAIGGREALGKITSRKSAGTVTIATPQGNISGPIEVLLKVPNKSSVHMTLDLSALGGSDMTIEQRFDGTAGYAMNSMQGDSEITGNQLDNMRNNVLPTPLLHYKEGGAAVELLPHEKIGDKDAIVLLVTPKTGSPVRIFLDAETHLLLRTVTKINSPQTGDVEQTSDFSDYRAVDGVKVPFHVASTNPLQSLTIVLTKVEQNVAIDDAMFAKKQGGI
jgi:zinc protease